MISYGSLSYQAERCADCGNALTDATDVTEILRLADIEHMGHGDE
jgi:hypothetical protein